MREGQRRKRLSRSVCRQSWPGLSRPRAVQPDAAPGLRRWSACEGGSVAKLVCLAGWPTLGFTGACAVEERQRRRACLWLLATSGISWESWESFGNHGNRSGIMGIVRESLGNRGNHSGIVGIARESWGFLGSHGNLRNRGNLGNRFGITGISGIGNHVYAKFLSGGPLA